MTLLFNSCFNLLLQFFLTHFYKGCANRILAHKNEFFLKKTEIIFIFNAKTDKRAEILTSSGLKNKEIPYN